MKETVGLRSHLALYIPKPIKQDALMFRRIGIPDCEELIGIVEQVSGKDSATEFQWLIEQGIVFDPNPWGLYENSALDDETKHLLDEARKEMSRYKDLANQREAAEYLFRKMRENYPIDVLMMNQLRQFVEYFVQAGIFAFSGELLLRPLSAYYRNTKKIDAFPIFNSEFPQLHLQKTGMEDVIDITINHLPIPDDSTSWEQIIDFRNDPDTEKKFLDLRNWMNEIARAKLTPLEIEQKLEWLLKEYREHLKVHHMKTNASTLETIIVTGAEIAENLVKLQFGKLAKGLFSLRHRKLALLEGELKSPGREIAFISKARETFR